jgi:hypothetical protein
MKKENRFLITTITVIVISIVWCIFIFSGVYQDTKKWREVYENADNFEYCREMSAGLGHTFILRDEQGNEVCSAWLVTNSKSTFICFNNIIVLHSTNKYYSKRLAKKLIDKIPDNAQDQFLERTVREFEKHLKEYDKNNKQ